MSERNVKLLILALDGFDPELFTRWRDRLPNLSSLADDGVFTTIASTTPPMTFPAWSTFLTGVNPGKHGIFDFTERTADRLGLRFVNATRRRCPSFLRIASDNGLVVGSAGLPTTYPPEILSGFQISGFDTPLPSKADSSYIYPNTLADKIGRELGGYYFGDFNESRIGRNWHRRVFEKLVSGIEHKEKLVRLLLKEYDLDLLLLHVGETDTVGHHFWSFCDPDSPRHVRSDDEQLNTAISKVYIKADDLVGSVMRAANPEAVMIVSDHGMGGTSNRMIYINRYLEEAGLLKFSGDTIGASHLGTLKNLGMRFIPYRLQQKIFRLAGGRIASKIESLQRFGGINWSKTTAYSEEVNYFPSLYLNIKGREPHGIVSPEDIDKVMGEVSEALASWRDPCSGSAVVREVYRCGEVYSGSEIDYAPDLLIELNQPEGYSYALGRSTSKEGATPWRKLRSDEYLGRKGATMNGSHRRFGTLILNVAGKRLTPPVEAALLDIAPTALSLLKVGIPDWMEGKCLVDSKALPSVRSVQAEPEVPYTDDEEQIIRDRLAKMGYLE